MSDNSLDIDSLNFESLAREILTKGRKLTFRARGGSMRPLIQDGDLLEVAPVRKATMALGDVFLFSDRGGRLMAHRLIHKYQHKGLLMLVLQGDANPREDLAVDDALIIGQVIRKKGPSGEFNFTGWLHRTIAWFFILFAPMIKRIYIRSKILSSQKL